jgi:hypothetical protein
MKLGDDKKMKLIKRSTHYINVSEFNADWLSDRVIKSEYPGQFEKQLIYVNTDDWKKFIDIMTPELKDLYERLYNVTAVAIMSASRVQREGFDVENIPLAEEGAMCIAHPLVEQVYDYATGKFVVRYTNEYLQNNYVPDRCVYTSIIEAYGEAFDNEVAKYKGGKCGSKKKFFRLTYESLYEFFHGRYLWGEADWRLSLNKARKFYDEFKLDLVVIGVNNEVFWTTRGDERKKKKNGVTPQTHYVLLHDRHVYTTTVNYQLINNVVWYRENPPPAEMPKTRYRLSREKFNASEWTCGAPSYRTVDMLRPTHFRHESARRIKHHRHLTCNYMRAQLLVPEPV